MSALRKRGQPSAVAAVQQQLPLSVSIVKGNGVQQRRRAQASSLRNPSVRGERAVSEVLSVLPMDQILSTTDIEQITGKHRSTVFRWMARGRFPRKVVREGLPVGWRRSDVERWLRGNPSATGLGDSRLR